MIMKAYQRATLRRVRLEETTCQRVALGDRSQGEAWEFSTLNSQFILSVFHSRHI